MEKENSFDMLFYLDTHGWSTLYLIIDKELIELSLTHIFNDPTKEIMQSCISLLEKNDMIEFELFDEPGSYKWNIRRIGDEKHKAQFEVKWCNGVEVLKEYRFCIKIEEYIKIIYTQMLKNSLLLDNKEFQNKGRKECFDKYKFAELKEKLIKLSKIKIG